MANGLVGFFLKNRSPIGGYTLSGYRGSDVPKEMLITIFSSYSSTITVGILQEELSFRVGSTWESLFSSPPKLAEVAAQQFGISLQNALTSRRMWRSTDPLQFTITLHFREEYDAKVEVVDACRNLQKMALPGMRDIANFNIPLTSKNIDIDLLTPPGPSVTDPEKGDNITIYIGNFLIFRPVIIKDVNITYKNIYGSDGLPKAATANVLFESYEVLWKDRLDDIYSKTDVFSGDGNKPTSQTSVPNIGN